MTEAVILITPCCNRKAGVVAAQSLIDSIKKVCNKCQKPWLVVTHGTEVKWIPRDLQPIIQDSIVQGGVHQNIMINPPPRRSHSGISIEQGSYANEYNHIPLVGPIPQKAIEMTKRKALPAPKKSKGRKNHTPIGHIDRKFGSGAGSGRPWHEKGLFPLIKSLKKPVKALHKDLTTPLEDIIKERNQ